MKPVQFHIKCNPDVFFSNLDRLEQQGYRILYTLGDIVLSDRSPLHVKKKGDEYIFSYPRPFSMFSIRGALLDYVFRFRVQVSGNGVHITGIVRMKRFVMFWLIFCAAILISMLFTGNKSSIGDYWFEIWVIVLSCSYFWWQYKAFKKRMKLLLEDIATRKVPE